MTAECVKWSNFKFLYKKAKFWQISFISLFWSFEKWSDCLSHLLLLQEQSKLKRLGSFLRLQCSRLLDLRTSVWLRRLWQGRSVAQEHQRMVLVRIFSQNGRHQLAARVPRLVSSWQVHNILIIDLGIVVSYVGIRRTFWVRYKKSSYQLWELKELIIVPRYCCLVCGGDSYLLV